MLLEAEAALPEPPERTADSSASRRPRIPLRIIATSDLHASLLPYDYCADRPDASRGLSAISRQIAVARSEVANSLLLDNGDFLQGNPLADFVASAPRRRRAHPVITAFNTLGYDAVTLGNHEFDYGLRFLSNALADARFAVVSANIATRLGKSPARDQTLFPAFTVLKREVLDRDGQRHTLRIGVIGFAPPQIEEWDRDVLLGRIRTRDIIASAQAWLPRLRARGTDLIVALAHSGIGAAEPHEGMENAAAALAALPDIDAVIAGHSHQTFPGSEIAAVPGIDPVRGLLAGKPAVMPGHSGSHVGVIDLELESCDRGERRWRIVAATARLGERETTTIRSSCALQQALAPDHRAALAWSRRLLGETKTAIHTHFATIAPSKAIEILAEAKSRYVQAALTGTLWSNLPIVASAASYRCGGRGGPGNFTDIPTGPVRMRNLSDLYPFPNSIVALLLSGDELTDWLERAATVFRQATPGERDVPLLDPSVPAFHFEAIPSLSYAIDLSKPARFDGHGQLINPQSNRIVGLRYGGVPVEPTQPFILVTNNHRAGLARMQGNRAAHQVILNDGTRVQSILSDHVRTRGISAVAPGRHWHLLKLPGTSVTFAAGPGADCHLADIANYRPERLETDPQGFAHYRLHL